MADKPRLATIEIVFFLAAIFFAALVVRYSERLTYERSFPR